MENEKRKLNLTIGEILLLATPFLVVGLIWLLPMLRFTPSIGYPRWLDSPDARLLGTAAFFVAPLWVHNIRLVREGTWRWGEGIVTVIIWLLLVTFLAPFFAS